MTSGCGCLPQPLRVPKGRMSMARIVYNIPTDRLAEYRPRPGRLVLRSPDASDLVSHLTGDLLPRVDHVQWTSPQTGLDAWGTSRVEVPVDVVLAAPALEFDRLYAVAERLAPRPLRVTVPVRPAFVAAVKLAVSLNLPVHLTLDRPGPAQVRELLELLDVYLHRPTVSQPIEFFHTLLLAFLHDRPACLWEIQERDPARVRFIADDGSLALPDGHPLPASGEPDRFVRDFADRIRSASPECAACHFFPRCRGFFKYPQADYSCRDVQELWERLQTAASDLAADLTACRPAASEGGRHA